MPVFHLALRTGAAFLLFLINFPWAAEIRTMGVLGNSGEAGATLVRVGDLPFDRCATGVALDSDFTLWVSGGNTLNRVGLDGRLIERIPVEPKGSVVNSRTFAVLNDTLYFLGNLPDGQFVLFAAPMTPTKVPKVARPILRSLPERRRDYIPYCLAPQPLNGRLVLACEPKEFPDRIGIYVENLGHFWRNRQARRRSLAFA